MSGAKKQGHLDGLCGVYAVVNAFLKLKAGNENEIFRACCCALSDSRWPKTLWEGTSLRDLETMIKSCLEKVNGLDRFHVSYPFRVNQPKSNGEFWQEFDSLFANNREKKSAIIGLTKPDLHWLVALPKRRNIEFIDSDRLSSNTKVPREDIYAGDRRTNGQTYCVDRKEVIIIEKVT